MRPPPWVFSLGVTPLQRLLLCALWSFANPENTDAQGRMLVWPRTRTVAERLGMKPNKVRDHLRALVAAGATGRCEIIDVGAGGFWLAVDAPGGSEIGASSTPKQGAPESGAERPESGRRAPGIGAPSARFWGAHKNEKRTTTEREENDKTSPTPLTLIPDDQVESAPSVFDRIATALFAARQRAYEGSRKRVEHTPLTETRRKHVNILLREGYTCEQIEKALRRKGEAVFREPTYRTRRNGEWREVDSRPLVSIEHLVRRDRQTKGLENLERLLANEDLDDRAQARAQTDASGRALRDGAKPDHWDGMEFAHEEVPGCSW